MALEDIIVAKAMISFLTVIVLLLFLDGMLRGSKTRQYRKKLADMYVAGKIRQLAQKENIDINKELKEYIKFTKHEKKFMQDLDDAIETDMKTKVEDEQFPA